MKQITKIFLIYRCSIPFLGFLGVSLYLPDKIGILAFTGWLAALLYDYFFILHYWDVQLTYKEIITGLLAPLIVVLSQMFRQEGGFWNYFIEMSLIEIISLNLGLILAFIAGSHKVNEEGMVAVLIIVILFIGASLAFIFMYFFKVWIILNNPIFNYTLVLLFIALVLNTRDDFIFIDSIAKGKVIVDESYLEDNFMIIIGIIVGWMGLIPLISFIIRKLI